MWSFGILVYVLLSMGAFPFKGKRASEIYKKIVMGRYDFPNHVDNNWNYISDKAKDFVKKLLVVNPQARFNAEDAMKHEWLHCSESCFLKNDSNLLVNKIKSIKTVTNAIIFTSSMSKMVKHNSLGSVESLDFLKSSIAKIKHNSLGSV